MLILETTPGTMHPMYIFVFISLSVIYLRHWLSWRAASKSLQKLAAEHGCAPAPYLEGNRRLWGLNGLRQWIQADSRHRLLQLILFHMRQSGWTIQGKFMNKTVFFTVDPANLEAMLNSKASDYSISPRHQVAAPLFGDGVFTLEGEAWRRSRSMIRPHLAHGHYEDLSLMQQPIEDLLAAMARLSADSGTKSVVDLQPLFFGLTLDVTTSLLLGESIRSLASDEGSPERVFADALDSGLGFLARRFRLPGLHWLIGGRAWRGACADVHAFVDAVIDRNLAAAAAAGDGKNKKPSFLSRVAEACPDREALRGQIINVLGAGRDTTACLLSWTFFILVRHPDALTKLRTEIANTPTKPGNIRRADLKGMKYLQAVLKEVLRLYPSAPINGRTAVRDTVLPTGGGLNRRQPVLVPRGSVASFNVYALHRRTDLYGMDAEVFRPERWLDDGVGMPLFRDAVTRNYGYLPFGGGPRVCIGMDFALTEAAYAVVRILDRFPVIALPDGEKVEPLGLEKQTLALLLRITDGCNVRLG